MRKLETPVKRFELHDCGFRIDTEEDGLVVHVFPVSFDEEGGLQATALRGKCKAIFDPFNNLVGCKDVGVCSKNCMICTIYDDDGNELGKACRCTKKCPEPPEPDRNKFSTVRSRLA